MEGHIVEELKRKVRELLLESEISVGKDIKIEVM
jgi:hypothetical protein